MLSRRIVIALFSAAALAACNSITEIERAQKDTGPLRLNTVNVDVSDLSVTTEGRAINKTTSELQQDLQRAVTAEAQKRSVPDGLPANVNIKVERIKLARVVDRVLAGTSFIESKISITEAATGAFIVNPVSVTATAEQLRGPGPVGLATAATTSIDADYQSVINAYARVLLESLDASR